MELSTYNFTFLLVCCLTFPFGYGFAGLSAYSLTVDDYQGPWLRIFTKILSRFSMFGASHFSMRKNTINELNFLQFRINAFMTWGLGLEFFFCMEEEKVHVSQTDEAWISLLYFFFKKVPTLLRTEWVQGLFEKALTKLQQHRKINNKNNYGDRDGPKERWLVLLLRKVPLS